MQSQGSAQDEKTRAIRANLRTGSTLASNNFNEYNGLDLAGRVGAIIVRPGRIRGRIHTPTTGAPINYTERLQSDWGPYK